MSEPVNDNGASLIIDYPLDGSHTLAMKELQRLLAIAAANSMSTLASEVTATFAKVEACPPGNRPATLDD